MLKKETLLQTKKYEGPILTATGGQANDYGSDTVYVSTKSGVVKLDPLETRVFPMSELQLSTTDDGISWHVYVYHWGEPTAPLLFENMTKKGATGNGYWNESSYYQVTDMTKDAGF